TRSGQPAELKPCTCPASNFSVVRLHSKWVIAVPVRSFIKVIPHLENQAAPAPAPDGFRNGLLRAGEFHSRAAEHPQPLLHLYSLTPRCAWSIDQPAPANTL